MAEEKYNEPPQEQEEEEKHILNELLHYVDDHDPSISDKEHSKSHSKSKSPRTRMRTKSKSSGNVLLQSSHKKPSFKSQRRHSESSSESHSSDYHRKHPQTKPKLPILIPLNVNGKNLKRNLSKKGSKSPSKRSFGKGILSKYKSKRNQNDNNIKSKRSSLGISGPLNVQHVIHVEWDPQSKAYKVNFCSL